MNLSEELRVRMEETLGLSWMKTDAGSAHSDVLLSNLQQGRIVVTRRVPDSAPVTEVVRVRRKRIR